MKKDNPFISLYSSLYIVSQLSITFITPVILCLFAGMWLCNRFGVGEWLTVAAIVFGIITGFFGVYNTYVRKLLEKDKRDNIKDK